ncbi:hypothetical protein Q0812_03635 [Brevundimonas sp. 2R-24]|uniref:Uncharacterized protein n=1 Tax=Peiella sedimenti TaxID=3061083 RepID=A0ABT8SML4_9CAUL|nr:hypothetical protein [Caulobacteraceae bacterium XZ-24]
MRAYVDRAEGWQAYEEVQSWSGFDRPAPATAETSPAQQASVWDRDEAFDGVMAVLGGVIFALGGALTGLWLQL